jgi:hypothetical protein
MIGTSGKEGGEVSLMLEITKFDISNAEAEPKKLDTQSIYLD